MLHPNEHSSAQQRLEAFASSLERRSLAEHPMNVHLVAISSYLVHWQEHIESLAKSLEEIVSCSCNTEPKPNGGQRKHILVVDTRESRFDAKKLQSLRHIEDKIVCRACRYLKSTRTLVRTLADLNKSLPTTDVDFAAQSASIAQEFQLFEHRLGGHINAAKLLAQRVTATVGLVRFAWTPLRAILTDTQLTNVLELQNQGNSHKIRTHMLQLTRESVDDNVTVRVITVCTLIYLPASFMAVSSSFERHWKERLTC